MPRGLRHDPGVGRRTRHWRWVGLDRGSSLTLFRTAVTGNAAYNAGGVFSNGTLLIVQSTISGNQAQAIGGGMAVFDGTTTVVNSTISGNALAPAGYLFGGGFSDGFDGKVRLFVSTVAANSPTNITPGPGGVVTMRRALLGGPGQNCYFVGGVTTSQGRNLDRDGSCQLDGFGDLDRVDPRIGPLAFNGGPTETHALLTGSPAVDTGGRYGCRPPHVDQRGVARPQDGDGDGVSECDIGSFERRDAEAGSTTLTQVAPALESARPSHADAAAYRRAAASGSR